MQNLSKGGGGVGHSRRLLVLKDQTLLGVAANFSLFSRYKYTASCTDHKKVIFNSVSFYTFYIQIYITLSI
jgi:hypothetical protein